jgi:hypothetical protein
LEFCQRFFAEFRSDITYEFIPNTYDSRYVSNRFQFEDYLRFLKAALRSVRGALWCENNDSSEAIDKSKRPPSDLFSDKAEHFDDALFFLQVRLIVELAAPETVVPLDLTALHRGGWLSARNPRELFKDWSHLLRRRIELNYQLYGFVVEEDPRLDARRCPSDCFAPCACFHLHSSTAQNRQGAMKIVMNTLTTMPPNDGLAVGRITSEPRPIAQEDGHEAEDGGRESGKFV